MRDSSGVTWKLPRTKFFSRKWTGCQALQYILLVGPSPQTFSGSTSLWRLGMQYIGLIYPSCRGNLATEEEIPLHLWVYVLKAECPFFRIALKFGKVCEVCSGRARPQKHILDDFSFRMSQNSSIFSDYVSSISVKLLLDLLWSKGHKTFKWKSHCHYISGRVTLKYLSRGR